MGGGHYNRSLASYLPFACGSMFAVFLCSVLTLSLAMSLVLSLIVLDTSAYATTPTGTADLDLSVSVTPVISIRTLDSTATSEISALNFNIAPTSSGVRNTQTTVVDVSTSNVSGYNLLMQSDYRTDGTSSTDSTGRPGSGNTTSTASFTTSLINTNSTIAAETVGQIPTATTSAASSTSYWNYTKSWNETLGPTGNTESFTSSTLPVASTDNQLIPAYNTPTTIRDDVDIATASSQTNIDINVNVATDKSAGAYKNKLVFTAIANPIPVDYTLTFDKNTTDTVNNLPSPITATSVATSYNFTIPDVSGSGTLPAMTRAGYQLVGWSESPTERQGSGSGPDGLYVAGDTYTVIADDPSQPDYSQHGVGSGTLYAVWALEYTYTLNYSCQSGTTNCPATQSATTINTSHTFTIPSTTPTLDGYDFVNYTDNGAGTGNTYNPGDTITLTNTANTKTLTANFEEALPLFWRITTMQEMTPEVCNSVYTPSNVTGSSAILVDKASAEAGGYDAASAGGPYVAQSTLPDIRDGNTYTVRKLADGNCWMSQNLRAVNVKLLAAQSDNLTTDFDVPASALRSYTNGNTVAYAYTDPISDAGVLYSWYAAVGGTSTATGDVAPGSICPNGWELPRGSGDKSMQNMIGTIYGGSSNVNVMRSSPISIPATGMIVNGTYTTTGGWGNNYSIHYTAQSSVANNDYVVIGSSGRVDLRYSHLVTHIGFSVRCVAK